MTQEKIRSNTPWQFEREDPNGGKPHACVVVQISCLNQLQRPAVEIAQTRLPRLGGMNRMAQPCITLRLGQILPQPRRIAVPHLWPLLQPPLEITAPNHLINKFGRGFSPLRLYRRGNNLLLGQEPAPDVGRQHRYIPMRPRSAIKIAPLSIIAPHVWGKPFKPRVPLRTGCCHLLCHR